ncbi:MAG: hypothetical protein ABL903_04605 [Methylococcales bacterium]
MKNLFNKFCSACTFLIIVNLATAHAEGTIPPLFSYTVLETPEWGSFSQTDDPWARIINTQEEWQALNNDPRFFKLWQLPTTSPPPAIDFEHYQLVIGGLQSGPAGNEVVVTNVREELNEVQIFATAISLPCSGFPISTSPVVAILIAKTGKPINIRLKHASYDCIKPQQ